MNMQIFKRSESQQKLVYGGRFVLCFVLFVFPPVILLINNTFCQKKHKTVKIKAFASSSSALAVLKVAQNVIQHSYSPKRQEAGIFFKNSTKTRPNTSSTTSDSCSFQI